MQSKETALSTAGYDPKTNKMMIKNKISLQGVCKSLQGEGGAGLLGGAASSLPCPEVTCCVSCLLCECCAPPPAQAVRAAGQPAAEK